MGAPAFQYKQLFAQHGIVRFSGNFELYGDVSKRITALLTTITPRIEIYSVDESFLDLSELRITDYAHWGRLVRASILRHVGVPVSIGIAPSKTLAKLCADVAKTDDSYNGAVDWTHAAGSWRLAALDSFAVEHVWGVGRKLAPKLRAEGVSTALGLSRMRPQRAQQLMGIHGRQLVAELNGSSCYPLERGHKPAQSIMRGRTFGEDVNDAHVLESAIASMAARAAFALRHDCLLTRRIGFFTETNRHKPGYRRWSPEVRLGQPTNDTGIITSLLITKLNEIFNRNQQYHRLGVFLYDLIPESALQTDILGQVNAHAHDASAKRMQAVDRINTRHGRGKIYYAAENLGKAWEPKNHIRSPRYVSNWQELPRAQIRI
jgi:DNA polymerase V